MRERSRGRGVEGGWTWVEVLVVLAITAALAALAVPNLLAARVRNDEIAAVRALREIHRAQGIFRAAAAVDLDRDGRGEYGFLQELSGEKLPRGFVPGADAAAVGPSRGLLPQLRLIVRDDGVASLRGYRFRLWLPGEGGRAVGELRPGAAPGTPGRVDDALARDHWCAYAWPERDTARTGVPATGRRTFFVDQQGLVAATEGYTAEDAAGAPGPAPEAGAAYAGPGPLETITGAAALGTLGRDGRTWRVVR